uniref:Uncharacterized protein n=1 Tax=Tanacetum cinerariifolium TaxID=118510 RepID=A0A699KU02_TANCI|nr:hypothetical protein [Tanacetum cinerariifolium]
MGWVVRSDAVLRSCDAVLVSALEATCFGLCDEVSGYKLFKERIEEMHEAHIKALSDCVAGGAIGCAIEKGMHDRLATGIDHGQAGSTTETLEGSQLQPSLEQLMVPIYRLEDQVVIGDTFLSFSLEVAHNRIQRLRGDPTAFCLSLTDTMVPLFEPLFVRSLTCEVRTSGVPAITTTIFSQAGTILSTPSSNVPPSPRIVSEQEKLNVAPEHAPVS